MRPGYQPRSIPPKQASVRAWWLRPRFWLVIIATGVLVAGGAAYWEWIADFAFDHTRVLLPADLAPTPPHPNVPPRIAAFAGFWGGDRWDGGPVPHSLVVEHVGADSTATVVYAWGADLEMHCEHGWWRLVGKIADGVLTLDLPNEHRVQYSIGADGRAGSRHRSRGRAQLRAAQPHRRQ